MASADLKTQESAIELTNIIDLFKVFFCVEGKGCKDFGKDHKRNYVGAKHSQHHQFEYGIQQKLRRRLGN